MSSDDVTELADQPCPCGGGRLVVHSRIPDHFWVRDKQETWDASITCPVCNQAYALVEQVSLSGDRVPLILVNAEELADRKKKLQRWHEESDALMSSQSVKAILNRFISALKDQRSVAATFRFLQKHSLLHESEGTFRKRFRQGAEEAWVRDWINIYYLPPLMQALAVEDEHITQTLDQIRTLRDQYQAPLTPVGDPLTSVRRSTSPFF